MENEQLDKIEKRLEKIGKKVDNHIPSQINDVDKKIDKVIEGQEKMWPMVCESNKMAAKAFLGLKNLTERLMRRKYLS